MAFISDFAACYPHALPNKKYPEVKDRAWADKPVAAVVVVETPENWHEDLQVICDLLRYSPITIHLLEQEHMLSRLHSSH